MIPDLKINLETVLTAFGMWREGEKCSCTTFKGMIARGVYRCVKCGFTFNGVPNDPVSRGHDIPLPDLTPELAWRVLMAARAFSYDLVDQTRLHVKFALDDWFAGKDTEAEALITAIAAALEK